MAAAEAAANANNADLSARTRAAIARGARVIVWSETSGLVLKRGEGVLLRDLSTIAHEASVYIFAAYGALNEKSPLPLENRFAAISPTGGTAWIFDKAHPIYGAESENVRAGKKVLPIIDTLFGRIGIVICHDADFADVVGQTRARGVDLLIVPSSDWPEILELHADMTRYRAV